MALDGSKPGSSENTKSARVRDMLAAFCLTAAATSGHLIVNSTGTLYVAYGNYASQAYGIQAIDIANGRVKWTSSYGSLKPFKPVISPANGDVYTRLWNPDEDSISVRAHNAADGTVKWTYDLQGKHWAGPGGMTASKLT